MSDTVERHYYLVVPLLGESTVDRIVSVLVKRGYTVGPLASSRKAYHTAPNNIVTLLALNVSRYVKPDTDISIIYDDIVDVMNVVKAKYLSIWLSDPVSTASFQVGNVVHDPAGAKVNTGTKPPPQGIN